MRSFQNWLDLQHYEHHLKRLQSIKLRAPSRLSLVSTRNHMEKQLKFRSKSNNKKQMIGTKCQISDQQNFEKFNVIRKGNLNQCKIKLKSKMYNGTKVSQYPNQKYCLKQINDQCYKQNQHNKQGVTNTKQFKQFQQFDDQKTQQYRSAQQPQQIKYNHKKNSSSYIQTHSTHQRSYFDRKSGFQSPWQSRVEFNCSTANKQNYRACLRFTCLNSKPAKYNQLIRSSFKVAKIKQGELMKYFRFSQENGLNIHHFKFQIRVIKLPILKNHDLLSFWIQAKSFNQCIKSSYMTYEELATKTIHMSFMNNPKTSIQISIKYFRKLQQFCYGPSLLVTKNKESINEAIELINNSTLDTIQLKIISKATKNQQIKKQKKYNISRTVKKTNMI